MSEPFIGQITLFPYSFPPKDWADCHGQLLPIAQYTALFSLIGTYFGGNGTTNFALPDLRGRVAVGASGTQTVGDTGGVETVQMTLNTMPAHSHNLNATQSSGTVNKPTGNVLASVFQGDLLGNGNQGAVYSTGTPDIALVPESIAPAGARAPAPHNNIQPSLALRYCIALQGTFPQRG